MIKFTEVPSGAVITHAMLSSSNQKIMLTIGGFEDRSVSVVNKFPDEIIFEYSILLQYCNQPYEKNVSNSNIIKKKLKKISREEIIKTPCYYEDPDYTCMKLLEECELHDIDLKNYDLYIDITSFTTTNLLVILSVLHQLALDIYIFYTEPFGYTKKLTSGVKSYSVVPHFEGDVSESKPTLCIIISGFEVQKIEALKNFYFPKKIIYLYTKDETIDENRQLWMQKSFSIIKQEKKSGDSIIPLNALDIIGSKEILSQIARKYSKQYNIILAPFSNKITLISVFLMAIENPSVQIAYIEPASWSERSFGEGSTFIFQSILK